MHSLPHERSRRAAAALSSAALESAAWAIWKQWDKLVPQYSYVEVDKQLYFKLQEKVKMNKRKKNLKDDGFCKCYFFFLIDFYDYSLLFKVFVAQFFRLSSFTALLHRIIILSGITHNLLCKMLFSAT